MARRRRGPIGSRARKGRSSGASREENAGSTVIDVRLRRAYDAAEPADGERYLVDRLWPRGLDKAKAALAGWARDAAPSTELRKWFGHDPARWPEFRRRYLTELRARPDAWRPLLDAARRGRVTLLFAARDAAHNNAVVLKSLLVRAAASSDRTHPS